jgi:carbonic anhydrase
MPARRIPEHRPSPLAADRLADTTGCAAPRRAAAWLLAALAALAVGAASVPAAAAPDAAARAAQELDSARLDALNMRIADLLSRQNREARVTPKGDLVIRVRPTERSGAQAIPTAIRPVEPSSTAASRPATRAAAPTTSSRASPRVPPAAIAATGASPLDPAAMTIAAARLDAQPPPGPAAPDGTTGWSYGGERGPEHWASLHPAFARCAGGNRQSPINIRGGVRVDLEPIRFEYQPVAFSVVDNGHTVSARLAPGSALTVMGRRYELVEFHFHRPGEERVDGRIFDMSAHLVHRDADGRQAVVAVLLERGVPHPAIQQVWNSLPLERGEPLAAPAPVDPGALLPAGRGYYTYMGSRTTPPCDEGVLWMVMKEPVPISAEQIAIFSRLYPMNARPLQALGGRLIKESN